MNPVNNRSNPTEPLTPRGPSRPRRQQPNKPSHALQVTPHSHLYSQQRAPSPKSAFINVTTKNQKPPLHPAKAQQPTGNPAKSPPSKAVSPNPTASPTPPVALPPAKTILEKVSSRFSSFVKSLSQSKLDTTPSQAPQSTTSMNSFMVSTPQPKPTTLQPLPKVISPQPPILQQLVPSLLEVTVSKPSDTEEKKHSTAQSNSVQPSPTPPNLIYLNTPIPIPAMAQPLPKAILPQLLILPQPVPNLLEATVSSPFDSKEEKHSITQPNPVNQNAATPLSTSNNSHKLTPYQLSKIYQKQHIIIKEIINSPVVLNYTVMSVFNYWDTNDIDTLANVIPRIEDKISTLNENEKKCLEELCDLALIPLKKHLGSLKEYLHKHINLRKDCEPETERRHLPDIQKAVAHENQLLRVVLRHMILNGHQRINGYRYFPTATLHNEKPNKSINKLARNLDVVTLTADILTMENDYFSQPTLLKDIKENLDTLSTTDLEFIQTQIKTNLDASLPPATETAHIEKYPTVNALLEVLQSLILPPVIRPELLSDKDKDTWIQSFEKLQLSPAETQPYLYSKVERDLYDKNKRGVKVEHKIKLEHAHGMLDDLHLQILHHNDTENYYRQAVTCYIAEKLSK